MDGKFYKGIPIIETKRLKLRNIRMDDMSEYYDYHTDSDLVKYYDWKPDTISDAKADIESILEDCQNLSRIHWAITMKDNDTIIGDLGILIDTFGLKGEVNYILSKSCLGFGIMTEALNSAISYCFSELDLIRIQALSVPDNQPSNDLLKRVGFIREGLLRKYGYNTITNNPVDLAMWSLLKCEYNNYAESKISDILYTNIELNV